MILTLSRLKLLEFYYTNFTHFLLLLASGLVCVSIHKLALCVCCLKSIRDKVHSEHREKFVYCPRLPRVRRMFQTNAKQTVPQFCTTRRPLYDRQRLCLLVVYFGVLQVDPSTTFADLRYLFLFCLLSCETQYFIFSGFGYHTSCPYVVATFLDDD